KELEILGYDFTKLTEADIRGAISETSFKTIDDLFASVGEGLTTKRQAVKFILGKTIIPNEPKKETGVTKKPEMTNFEGMKINIAPCCMPTKRDKIKSYVTRGRGLTVHRADCSNLSHLEAERIFDFNPWQKSKILTEIEVLAEDRIGLIRDVTNAVSSHHINIENITNHHKPGSKRSRLNIKISVNDLTDCVDLINDISEIESVTSVQRAL
ncbi:hypothetical protein K0A96_02170, partial [Patescibacteria group bacterium]|nr:hypothetical protein [Patescibacteria group bacterium]